MTVERFIKGNFTKYVNNDGKTRDGDSELSKKAEALCHFSYVATNEKLLLVDIQGFGYTLCDPEIATPSIMDDSEFQFCSGNLGETAIDNFKEGHICNKYCRLVGLTNSLF